MVKCSAPFCGNTTYKKTPEITFHRYPKDEYLKKAWLVNISRKNWQPKASSVICSEHFEAHLVDNKGFRTTLAPSAIPTIFKLLYKDNIQSPTITLEAKRRSSDEKILPDVENLPQRNSILSPQYDPPSPLRKEITEKSIPGVHDLHNTKLIKLKRKCILNNRKMKALKQQIRRLKTKVVEYSDIISTLKKGVKNDDGIYILDCR